MQIDLTSLNKPEKMKLAEKHLNKYMDELKRHFDFSDFQIIWLLEKSSQQMKKAQCDNFKKFFCKLLTPFMQK